MKDISPRLIMVAIIGVFLIINPAEMSIAVTQTRSTPIMTTRPVLADVAFCKEVLILHHSHADVGYTHPQSMYWELQKGYLNAALDMLDRTEDWPDDISRPRWTAETTSPVMRWLETASSEDIERFCRHVKTGRFGISGLEYNTTPLCSLEGLARQLYHVRTLRDKYGANIRTVNQHDVTGIPWTAVELLLDSDIELLIMGINLHLSGTPKPRPAIYRWKGPSGRELLVMNGEQYSMFDQWCNTLSRDLDTIQEGLFEYLRHVNSLDYPFDFVYLSATHAPMMYDNSPPNQNLPDLVRRWNEEGRHPSLRLVTPNELLAKIKKIPREEIPIVSGDWTDYWNFGCGSSALETSLIRQATANADVIDLLSTWNGYNSRTDVMIERLWSDIHLYNEHTWGASNSLQADNPNVITQWHLKAYPAHNGKPLSDFLLRDQLHRLAGNTWQSWSTPGILVVNPTGLKGEYCVSGSWKGGGKRIESHYMRTSRESTTQPFGELYGPVALEPYSWRTIPWSTLKLVPPSGAIKSGADFMETDTYRLTFDPTSGMVTGLLDKRKNRQLIADSNWGFFQLVHERPTDNDRHAFHVRSVVGERYGRTGWKPGWAATRTSYTGMVKCHVEKKSRSVRLLIEGKAKGLKDLQQCITLHAGSPVIDLWTRFTKEDVRSPEAIYFAFPLSMPENWRAHFDTAGVPTEVDIEQIPGSCRDWVTVETFASIHQPDFGVTLYCPDAPLVMFGDFNFGQNQTSIPRRRNPLLLAWPVNNYWETNFRASQPGVVELRYSFTSHGPFDPVKTVLEGQNICNPPITHPVLEACKPGAGRFIDVQGEDVVVTHVKIAEDHDGIIARMINLGRQPVKTMISLPGRRVAKAWIDNLLENNQEDLVVEKGSASVDLVPRCPATIRLISE
jgi:hypothetical protein